MCSGTDNEGLREGSRSGVGGRRERLRSVLVIAEITASVVLCIRFVTPGYFESMGIPLRAGRDVSESDTLDSPPVVVVSESFVRRYWPDQNPLGRSFHFAMNGFQYALQDKSIVGVVGDVRFRGLERDSEPQVYLAYRQIPDRTSTYYAPKELVVRSSTDATALTPSIRSIIQKADPELPISAARTLRDVVDLQTAPRSTQIRLVAAFAALSLLLAGLGIHGLLSFAWVSGHRNSVFESHWARSLGTFSRWYCARALSSRESARSSA